jgi:hypothetical protein
MMKLLQKDQKFDWMNAYERNFYEMKKKLTTAPVLTLSDTGMTSLYTVMLQDEVWVVFSCRKEELLPMPPDS